MKKIKSKKKLFGTRLSVDTIDNFVNTCNANGMKQGFIIERLLQKYLDNPAILSYGDIKQRTQKNE